MTSERKNLNCKDICSIIKECAKNGVAEFKYQTLQVSFKAKEIIEVDSHPVQVSTEEIPENYIEEVEKEHVHQEELILKERDLANMPIEDPEQFEKMLAEGSIGDVVDNLSGD